MPDGVATMSWNAQTEHISVLLDVHGLTPGSSAAIRLRPGSCLGIGASALVSFGPASADASGALRTTAVSTQAVPGGIPHQAVIDLETPGDSTQATSAVAPPALLLCTDIPASGETAPQRLFAPPQLKPAATATIEDQGGGTLAVHMTALALPVSESFTVELHNGSCEAQGNLLQRAGDLASDASGSGSGSFVLPNTRLPAMWYVAVFRGATGTSGTAPTLLICGDAPR